MLLFLISFLLVFVSSYFITSILAPKKSILGLIYIFVLAFAQIVMTFEILSLFSAIKEIWVLGANVLFFAGTAFAWFKKGTPVWSLEFADFRNRLNNSLKLDKSLMWLYVGFLVLIIGAILLNTIMPITNADAQGYHAARSLFWIAQGNLNHFVVADIRALCLPINSEILYSWVLLFIKKDIFLGYFSFVGYILAIISLYNIFTYLGFCTRRKLWIIFILSSFASVLVQLSGTETDIIVAGLVSSAIFLFWYGLKNDKLVPIFMAALSYALAMGTKTPAIMTIPAVGLFFTGLCFYHKKFKPLGYFLIFGIINFLIFASYNYILNFIDYHDFMGADSFMVVSKNYYGLKAVPANLVKYFFMFFDFTGFKWSDYVGAHFLHFRNSILEFIHSQYIYDGIYTSGYNFQRTLLEPMMGTGILGFILYLPCLIWAFIKPIFSFKFKKVRAVLIFALIFFINIFVLSYLLGYMTFSVRFMMFFIVLSAPIMYYSYSKKTNPIKVIFVAFALYYLILVSTHLWPRPISKIGKLFIHGASLKEVRLRAVCKDYYKDTGYQNGACLLKFRLQHHFMPGTKILAFMSSAETIFILKSLYFDGYPIDFALMEDADKIDFSKYTVVVSSNEGQTSTNVKYFAKRKNECKIINNKLLINGDTLVPCYYMSNIMLTNTGFDYENHPYQVHCALSKNFLDKENLFPIGYAGVLKPNLHENIYYIIYLNKNLHVNWRKESKHKIKY